jgi:hypothetical protein
MSVGSTTASLNAGRFDDRGFGSEPQCRSVRRDQDDAGGLEARSRGSVGPMSVARTMLANVGRFKERRPVGSMSVRRPVGSMSVGSMSVGSMSVARMARRIAPILSAQCRSLAWRRIAPILIRPAR